MKGWERNMERIKEDKRETGIKKGEKNLKEEDY
jgi:hypothetical protein